MRARPAFTLPELILVLVLIGIVLGIAVPRFLHTLDVLSVRAARDALLSAAARTRSLAVARGGADLVVDESARLDVVSVGTVVEQIDLGARYRVLLDIQSSARTRVSLRYDALGVGRLAGLTVRLARGQAESGVTFSAYGRPRLW